MLLSYYVSNHDTYNDNRLIYSIGAMGTVYWKY